MIRRRVIITDRGQDGREVLSNLGWSNFDIKRLLLESYYTNESHTVTRRGRFVK